MGPLRLIGLLAAVFMTAFVNVAGASSAGTLIHFSSLDNSRPYKVSGTLYLPEKTPCPAVVMIHGTMGIDMRGEFYREPLLSAGIAIFEVDFKTGVYRGPMDRPEPFRFLPMAFAALKELRRLPSIDPNRIGIMGFSLGGHIALRTALESNRKQWMGDEKGFIAFAAFYPACKSFVEALEQSDSKLTGGPIIVFYGTKDCYGDGKAVPELKRLLASKYNFQLITVKYPGATHGFNLNAPPLHYFDPAAQGFGGYMAWNPGAANDSVTKVVAFLRENLAAK